MKKTIVLVTVFLIFSGSLLRAQSNAEKAHEKGVQGVELVDKGEVDQGVKLLMEARKLDPKNVDYTYEIAYAYYSGKEYKKAIKEVKSVLKSKDVTDLFYQLMGNSYDNMGQGEKAIEAYSDGLKKFPKSGKLHLEMGTMQLGAKNFNKALYYYEKGVEVEPTFPSNYYWAAKIYCNSSEEVWGMIYGEMFINLERNSKRTAEISKLLFDTYKSQIQFTSDTTTTVSFSKFATITLEDLQDTGGLRMPFGIGVYEPNLMLSIIGEKNIDLHSLHRIRQRFVDNYYKNGHNKKYPNLLFEYQLKINGAGHMEAYNHWILMKGDEAAFGEWHDANKEKWDAFVLWFKDNKMPVDDAHKFYSGQY